ncbi:secretin N-terminal domain-containing protein [Planctomycetota bacterium]
MPSFSKWLAFLLLTTCLMSVIIPSSCQAQVFELDAGSQPEGADEAKRAAIEKAMKEHAKKRGNPDPTKGDENKKEGKPEEKEKGKEESKKDGKKEKEEEGPKTVTRPTEPEKPFDPRQYEAVKPDLDGKYKLSFVGTPWPPMIEWLEEISGLTADWQELPGDYFNLRTQRSYSIPEIQDIVNRLLLARGYTILIDGEIMAVVKTEGINSSIVPRIQAEELAQHQPYEFGRVLFDLDWLMAEEAAKELKPLVSSNGKLTAFTGTNRIEVMDAVRNLQQINEMINQEQSPIARSKLVQEFELENVAAAIVLKSLKELVGSGGGGGGGGGKLNPQQMQQIQQQMQQMQRRGQDTSKLQAQLQGGGGGGGGGEGKVSFVINDVRNSIIATAPPNKMVIIDQTVKLLDVPSGRNDSLESYVGRIKAYRLVSLNPTEVVNILTETGGLDPKTRLSVDEDSKSLIASAPPWDHMTIQKLIDKLDGSSRQLRVLRLRRRRVDQVATTIQVLMVGEEKDNNNRGYRWWDEGSNEDDDTFRVAADVEHKQLLLWCNEQEYEQVLKLLQELGEIPEEGATPSKFRVLDEVPTGDTAEFLQRVKEAFQQMAPNAVEIDPAVEESLRKATEQRKADEAKKAKEKAEQKTDEKEKEDESDGNESETRDVRSDASVITAFVQSTSQQSPIPRDNAAPTKPAPIRITQDANGRLVIQCDDPRALDLFEELSAQLMPRPRGFHVFEIKHNIASYVAMKLETFFEDDSEENDEFPWFFFGGEPNNKDDKIGLGDQPKIKFVTEIDSNTVVVRNATDAQLRTIEELIKIYDVPEPIDPKRTRYTEIYKVKHSRASLITETIKAAFPDFLSNNDSLVQRGRQKNKNGNDDDDEKPMSSGGGLYSGQLSLGADDITNTIIISTKGDQLQKVIMPIIEQLDEEAKSADTVEVYALPAGTSSEIAASLSALLGDGSVGKNKNSENQERKNENENRDQNRDEQRRRRNSRNGEGDRPKIGIGN